MIIIRKYKKLDWFSFLDQIENTLKTCPDKALYFELQDEIKMRLIESVSEGAAFKFKAQANNLLQKFAARIKENESFATKQDLLEFNQLTESIQ